MNKVNYHTPVLLKESIEGLNIDPNGTYVDVTYGGGGHAREILQHLENGRLFAFDQDQDAEKNAIKDKRFTLINHNFIFLKRFLQYYGAVPVDGILADLGVSSHQIDSRERGFSFQQNADLDMRMDKDMEFTAKDLVNNASETELINIFSKYGEIKNSKTIANKIVSHRKQQKIHTVEEIKDIVTPYIKREIQVRFYAKLFQALRIKVNDELGSLKELLKQAAEMLKTRGRIVVISYHSLEDRIVKHFIKNGVFDVPDLRTTPADIDLPFKPINKKPIITSAEEVRKNTRSRSAKLRIAEKVI